MMYSVYHLRPLSESPFILEDYELVAVVDIRNTPFKGGLDKVFELTNHINQPWWDNDGIVCHKPKSRSTSVGDLIEIDNTFYRCTGTGWEKTTLSATLSPSPLRRIEDGPVQ